jgi:DNA-binding transcriptional regulator YiaG
MTTAEAIAITVARAMARSGRGKAVRESAGLSLDEFGSAIGVTASSVFRWERGEQVPTGPRAVRYAAFVQELEEVLTHAAT